MRHGAKTQGQRHGDVLVRSAPVVRMSGAQGLAPLALAALALLTVFLLAAPPATARPPLYRPWLASFVLDPDTGLWEQYGYAPAYTRNVPTFDSLDRPYIRSRTSDTDYTAFVHTLGAQGLERRGFLAAVRAAYPEFVETVRAGGGATDRIVFDKADRAYNPLTIRLRDGSKRNILMVSFDRCLTWTVVPLPGGEFATEVWTGQNDLDGPPFLAFWSRSALPTPSRTRRNDLWVTQPVLDGETVTVPEPTLVTSDCLGLSRASGGSSFAATVGDTTYFVWPAATPFDALGVPVMVAAYDHLTRTVGPAVELVRVPPDDDSHVQPGICADSRGYLHVVSGSHGGQFEYTRSLEPRRVDGNWTAPEPMLDDGYYVASSDTTEGRQTYLSFVCDQNDVLHVVYRQWRYLRDPYHRAQAYGALAHQRKAWSRPWSDARVVVVAADPGYCIFYQKLGIDHGGRLFLSASYAGGEELVASSDRSARYRILANREVELGQYRRRMLLVSDDGGRAWRLASLGDLAAGIDAPVTP
jgi:hypothetical protein